MELRALGLVAGDRGQAIPSNHIMRTNNSHCWVCGCEALKLVKSSNIAAALTSASFSITDSHYGITAAIYQCEDCGFLQCSELCEVLPFYQELVDVDYEAGRQERSLQARKLLEVAKKLQTCGRLLDIGAGSGMLVEQAINMGYQAEGIEPSRWLQKLAAQHNLPVHLGTFPEAAADRQFDLITLIDVVEHVSDPVGLLRNISKSLSMNGTAIVVTPDVGSVASRILGWKWWHFRVAHIGYFNKKTLLLAMDRAGLLPVHLERPAWFLTAEYLWTRVHRYIPRFLRLAPPQRFKDLVIRVNLLDSWLIACRRKP